MISYAVFCLKKKKRLIMILICVFFFLMIRRPPRSTQSRSSAASDVYKRQVHALGVAEKLRKSVEAWQFPASPGQSRSAQEPQTIPNLSLIHISEPTRLG